MPGLKRDISLHQIIRDEQLLEHLEKRFGKDHRKRKGLMNYIEYLARIGAKIVDQREAGFSLHYQGKSDLPPIDLFHIFKIDGQDLDLALHKQVTPYQLYNIELTRRALDVASRKKAYDECIKDVERSGYNWRDYINP
jgi:hypothetical protein